MTFKNKPGLIIKDKVYKEPLIIYGCDGVRLEKVHAPQIIVVKSNKPTLLDCYTWSGTTEGGIYVSCGHPDYRSDRFGMGENRLGHIGRLDDKRWCEKGVCDLSGLIDADPRADKYSQEWYVSGIPVKLLSIDKSDPQTGEYPKGATATVSEAITGEFFTIASQNFIESPIIRGCVASNPNGSGISVYGSRNGLIEDCVGFECKDYAGGFEMGEGNVIRNSRGYRNQVSPNYPDGYNQFEFVGYQKNSRAENNVGKVMQVHKGYAVK